jgi:nucleotide-binding universal stress UspA family protein
VGHGHIWLKEEEDIMAKRISRVLAAVDFSASARAAFARALDISRRHGAELVVVHAVPADHAVGWQSRERLALTDTLQQMAAAAGVDVLHRMQQGDPAGVILLHARSLAPDLIVVGTRQRRGLARLRGRSVGERVAAEASAPVLVVPEEPALGPAARLRHVAVAVDSGPESTLAIEHALSLTDQRVTLIHMVPGFRSGVPAHLRRWGVADYQYRLVREARRWLQASAERKRHRAHEIRVRVLIGNSVAEIGRHAGAIGADLLVVGATRRGPWSRAVFGTSASLLLRTAGLPVLTLPDGGAPGSGARAFTIASRGARPRHPLPVRDRDPRGVGRQPLSASRKAAGDVAGPALPAPLQ